MGKTVAFTFRQPAAGTVALVGDFNDWDIAANPMAHDPLKNCWAITLELAPGRYEYKFLVDGGSWWNDPNAPKVPNAWGSENSYLDVE